jgi:hypothetical protein
MSSVVELVVRLGDTILDVAHVPPERTYRIGTAPECDLAVPGFTSYPLVDDGRLRCPTGVPTSVHGNTTRIQVGLATIEATRVRITRTNLPRRRFDRRTPVYAAASLAVHVAIWLVAAISEPFERLVETQQPRLRYVHVAVDPPEPPPPPPAPQQQAQPASEPAPTPPAASAARRAPAAKRAEIPSPQAMPQTFGTAARDVADMVAKLEVARRVGELRPEDTYNEDDDNARGFGGGRRFDPGPAETIENGDYSTMAFDVTLCPKKSCSVRGPIPALYIRTHLHEVMPAIYDCYQQHASGPGTITLEFTIDVDGGVRNMRGSGLGETGACAARAANELYFKALGKDVKAGQSPDTHVRYPIRFNG